MKLFIIIIFIGQDNDSWGYHNDGNFYCCSESVKPYGPAFTAGDAIGCCLNFTNNTVFYTKNGVNLGNYYLIPILHCFKISKQRFNIL